ncbi:MAG: peroxiredoxin family protein [Gammaproteobacteria bacterium]|nr:peroxiredoxin family protein [Gammaproteobacteria bacterium]
MSSGNRVKAGEMARNFSLPDISGDPIQLSDYQGRNVLLSFFRDASCPFCNLRLYELTRKHAEYRSHGLEIIAVFNSSVDVVERYLGKRERPFPLLADVDREIFRLYGVESSWGMLMKGMFNFSRMFSAFSKGFMPAAGAFKPLMPADFLIDETGLVRVSYYSRNAANHISLKMVEKFITVMNSRHEALEKELELPDIETLLSLGKA